MINAKTLIRCLAPLLMTLAAGCAPAYHRYSSCHIDCQYCAPPPLPYVHYDGCVCHSCAGSTYVGMWQSAVEPEKVAHTQSVQTTD